MFNEQSPADRETAEWEWSRDQGGGLVGRENLRLVGAWEWSDKKDRRSSPGHVQVTEAQHL